MQSSFNIAVAQLDIVPLDPDHNTAEMKRITAEAATQGAHLVVFPELANSGYVRERDPEFGLQFVRCAEDLHGPTTEALMAVAEHHKIHIIFGLLERHPSLPGVMYDSAVLISDEGSLLGVQRKAHLPATEKHYFHPASTIDVHQSKLGCIGIAVCYDFLFPEYCRVLALKGAEILIGIFNMPRGPMLEPRRLATWTMTRARENVLFAISVNRTGPDGDLVFDGGSTIADPSGHCLASAADRAEILYATLTEASLLTARVYHSTYRDRRPELYQEIGAQQ